MRHLDAALRIMARLGVEHRPFGYILGALPLSYLALVIRWIASLLLLLWQIDCDLDIQQLEELG